MSLSVKSSTVLPNHQGELRILTTSKRCEYIYFLDLRVCLNYLQSKLFLILFRNYLARCWRLHDETSDPEVLRGVELTVYYTWDYTGGYKNLFYRCLENANPYAACIEGMVWKFLISISS